MKLKEVRDCISKDPVNSGRQEELDMARGLAVFFMILIHILEVFSTKEISRSLFGSVIYVLGSLPVAPVFMFILGTGIIYSRKQASLFLLKRGIFIFLAGFALNLARGFIPYFAGVSFNIIKAVEFDYPWYYGFFDIDILQFAGLAFIFIALLRKIKAGLVFYPLIATSVSLSAPFLWGLETGILPLDLLAYPLFGKTAFVYFPFFTWIFYPLMGVLFGYLLIRSNNKRVFYAASASIAVVIMSICALYILYNPHMDFGQEDIYNYYRHGFVSNFGFLSFALLWIALLYAIKNLIPGEVKLRLVFWSRKVMSVYVIQWILIGWSALFLGLNRMGCLPSVILMTAVVILTDRAVFFYGKYFQKKQLPVA